MDWADTPEQAAFRAQVKEVIQSSLPDYYRQAIARGDKIEDIRGGMNWESDRRSDDTQRREAAIEWGKTLAERGWFAPHWPKEYGGLSLTPMEQFIFNQEIASSGAPKVGGRGVSLLGPTLMVHGTDEQKKKWLPPILAGEIMYAQGYSEPGAGSDLASLVTRAVRDGDEFVINGQKIWTSDGHHADAIFALVRTDPDAPKHRGISFVVIEDIHTPGLTLRPLISMAWKHGFNETFFEDVRVPVSNVIGEINRGWYVGATLLDFERSNISGAVAARRRIEQLLGYVGTEEGRARSRLTSPTAPGEAAALRRELAERYVETEIGFNFSFRIISMQNRGVIPNYEASTAKMFITEAGQRLQRTGTKVFGLYSQLWDEHSPRAPMKCAFTHGYVTCVPDTIGGGSSEIQRNIIATRGLGLPRG